MRAYPLQLEGVPFRGHNMIGIYPIGEKIAVLHSAYGFVSEEQPAEDKRQPNYILLDMFSRDFKEHSQAHLCLDQPGFVSASDAELYQEGGKFILNTKRYKGFTDSIARLIAVSDTKLTEIGQSPEPIAQIYNDSKVYPFGDLEVYMHSPFIMACRNRRSGQIMWKTRLGAYLYTEVKAENGILYLGTDGNGGRFFAVNLADGNIVYSYNSKGTSNFIFYKEYVVLSGEKHKPVLLRRQDGALFKTIEFGPYQIPVSQQMIIAEDTLYAIAYEKDTVYAVSADLTEA